MNLFKSLRRFSPIVHQLKRRSTCLRNVEQSPRHLICFKQWTPDMVEGIISSAINLKSNHPDIRGLSLETLSGAKIMILQEVNRPILQLAISKAATMLGASDVNIIDKVVWEHDYMGRVFSTMADVIFVSTATHGCVQRFSEHSDVPVMCIHSRAHATVHSLSTIMAVVEEFDRMNGLTISYLGPPHPVLNSYLLLCPMLGANIKYKCCCDMKPVSPLLHKASEEMCKNHDTTMVACTSREEVFIDANVIIAGPTTTNKDKLKYFIIELSDLQKATDWIFFHTCPRGKEVSDDLFNHKQSHTFTVFENMPYIAAALMNYALNGKQFEE